MKRNLLAREKGFELYLKRTGEQRSYHLEVGDVEFSYSGIDFDGHAYRLEGEEMGELVLKSSEVPEGILQELDAQVENWEKALEG